MRPAVDRSRHAMGSAVDHPPIRGPRLWITFLKEVALWAFDLSAATTALRRSRGLLIDVTLAPGAGKIRFFGTIGRELRTNDVTRNYRRISMLRDNLGW